MTRLLITGFEGFSGAAVNPSGTLAEKAEKLNGLLSGFVVRGQVLPVSYKNSFQLWKKALEEFPADIVLSFGVAPRRRVLSLERHARNLCTASMPDNDGIFREGEILPGAPAAASGCRPLLALLKKELAGQGIPTRFSSDAGGYVCNFLYYHGLRHIQQERLALKMAFIHVPPPALFSPDEFLDKLATTLPTLVAALPES